MLWQIVVPVDVISWRVLEHLIRDRNHRADYSSFFLTAFRWWARRKEEQAREKPFIDLVLAQADASEGERARCERLLRWWKLKTKTHRVAINLRLEVNEAIFPISIHQPPNDHCNEFGSP